MDKKGVTILEVIISTIILAIMFAGVTGLFYTGKRYIALARSKVTAVEISKAVMAPLQCAVNQTDYGATDYNAGNPLTLGSKNAWSPTIDKSYNVMYSVGRPPGLPADSQMRRVRVRVRWNSE